MSRQEKEDNATIEREQGHNPQLQKPACDCFILLFMSHPPTQQHEIHHQTKKEEEDLIVSII